MILRPGHPATRRSLLRGAAATAATALLAGCITLNDRDVLPQPDLSPAEAGVPPGARLLDVPANGRAIAAYYTPGSDAGAGRARVRSGAQFRLLDRGRSGGGGAAGGPAAGRCRYHRRRHIRPAMRR